MKPVIFALILCLPFAVGAQVPLRVGIPTGQDPHIYLVANQPQGDEGLLLNMALLKAGFEPQYFHFPSLRVIERLRNNQIDATINVKEESLPFAFKSSFSYDFQNCAVTKIDRKIHLKKIEDFKDLDVVAFKNAKTSLERDHITEIMTTAKSYREIQDVDTRIKLLKSGRVDIMLSEKLVFLHYLQKFTLGSPDEYRFDCLFSPNRYYLIFRDKDHRDLFDRAFKTK